MNALENNITTSSSAEVTHSVKLITESRSAIKQGQKRQIVSFAKRNFTQFIFLCNLDSNKDSTSDSPNYLSIILQDM